MSVEIKNGLLEHHVQALAVLVRGEKGEDNKTHRLPVPPKGGYWLGRILRDLAPKYDKYNTDRNDLIRQYGRERKGELAVMPEDEGYAEAIGLLNALANETVECPFTVRLEDLGAAPEIGALVAALGDLVVAE